MPVQNFKGLSLKKNKVPQEALVYSATVDTNEDKPEEELKELVDKLNEKKSNVPFNLKMIPRSKIMFNEKNDYDQVDIEKLADSILHLGLIHNLEGYYDEENDLYVIESGERRTRAIDFLLAKFKDYDDTESYDYKEYLINVKGFEAGYPINVKKRRYIELLSNFDPELEEHAELDKKLELEEIDSELRLTDANEEVRPTDPQSKYKMVMKRANLMERRNALLPYRERINVNREVGIRLGITERQVQKYRGLDDLIPELKEEFLRNNITVTEGANYSSLSVEEQQSILKLIQEGKKVSADDIKKLKQEKEAAQTELILKEREISKLREESDNRQEEHRQELEKIKQELEQERDQIRQEISEEIRSNNPDRTKVEMLEKSLKKKEEDQQKVVHELYESMDLLKKKQDEIRKLEFELKDIKNKPAQDLERIRSEVKLSSSLNAASNAVLELNKAFRAYRKEWDNINDYKKDVSKIIEELNVLLKE